MQATVSEGAAAFLWGGGGGGGGQDRMTICFHAPGCNSYLSVMRFMMDDWASPSTPAWFGWLMDSQVSSAPE